MITIVGFFIFLIVFAMLMITGFILEFPDFENILGLLMFISIIPIFILVLISGKRRKAKKRRAFTQDTKDLVLRRQNHTCNICGLGSQHWDFDHIGSRSDNSPSNCQALCLDCHRTKTIREARQRKRR
jgi:hypothetical protein